MVKIIKGAVTIDTQTTVQKRDICANCHYPTVTCICHAVVKVEAPVPLYLLQDKWESRHAKNTGKLVGMCITNANIINADEDTKALCELKNLCLSTNSNVTLVFPDDKALPIKTLKRTHVSAITHLIFIDTTWKKATRLLALHPWIGSLESIKLENVALSRYEIRKSKHDKGISTIEAVEETLIQLYGFRQQGLDRCFDALKKHWRAYQTS
ncbi:tRNA-uridine aminocarboxypropyltransferase [Glaciecola sp. KUL10]|uniref:tRNA-uridine aminocarboxypropyltransferase n=1 Tax=Glaciecola sp. (strain KUL10) TaxID=2161813 RepID=UPI000D782457|nr:tRNA-uridine aminocarboxypropyltransferase [Glaciecola sp. KUL10]GBL06166.1 hypothetical protein KUL10_35040 [Glaciecola sp. KUL10]